MIDFKDEIRGYLSKEIEVLKNLDIESINTVVNLLNEARKEEANIYIFGNGGSSATASHFVNDFNKGVSEYINEKFRFNCLNDNIATVMAIANDIGFEDVFRFQLKGKLKREDVVIAISGSGNSANVINAVEYAKECGSAVVGVTGYNGGKLKELCDYSLHVPVNSMQITEDVHMIFDHLIMSLFYRELCGIEHLK